MNKITSYYRLKDNRLTELYRSLEISYPKFFKMDRLCKAGFLASEMVFRSLGEDPQSPKHDTALVFMNSSSSLDNDMDYQTTILPGNYYPSPALFVYTLANIVTGEVAIRNKIFGETSFYISSEFSAKELIITAEGAFVGKGIRRVLCGWTEYFKDACDVLVMMVEKEAAEGLDFTEKNINQIY